MPMLLDRRCDICGAPATQGVIDVARWKEPGGVVPLVIATDDRVKYRCDRHATRSRTFDVTASEYLRLKGIYK